jgi:hypothetical protein
MTSELSVAEAKASVPGIAVLSDAAIQLAIDDVELEIVGRFGPYGTAPMTYRFPRVGYGMQSDVLVLPRPAASISSIVEWLGTTTSRTLSANDYRLEGYRLRRLQVGDHPAYRFSSYGVDVVFVPADDTARRKMVTVDVLKLEAGFSGVSGSLRIGDYASSSAANGSAGDAVTKERAKIIGRLRPSGRLLW